MVKKTKKKVIVTRTAKDLAKLLNLPESVGIEWDVRYRLNKEIIRKFEEGEMTITELAKKSGTSRARITRVLKLDTSDISLEVLFRILGATGQTVQLKFLKAS